MARFRDRPTSDILILAIAATICTYVLVSIVISVIFLFINPESATLSDAVRNIADIINTLIGLLAGFLAGKSGALGKNGNGKKPEEEPPPPSDTV
jgi:hypothetical protein